MAPLAPPLDPLLTLLTAGCLLAVVYHPATAQRDPNELQMSNSGYRIENDP